MWQCDAVDSGDVQSVAKGVKQALATYGTLALAEMIRNCMAQDLSWKVGKMISSQHDPKSKEIS